jgi:hypothetical protein
MKEFIKQYRINKFEVCRLWKEKVAQDIEMNSLKTAYSKL